MNQGSDKQTVPLEKYKHMMHLLKTEQEVIVTLMDKVSRLKEILSSVYIEGVELKLSNMILQNERKILKCQVQFLESSIKDLENKLYPNIKSQSMSDVHSFHATNAKPKILRHPRNLKDIPNVPIHVAVENWLRDNCGSKVLADVWSKEYKNILSRSNYNE